MLWVWLKGPESHSRCETAHDMAHTMAHNVARNMGETLGLVCVCVFFGCLAGDVASGLART